MKNLDLDTLNNEQAEEKIETIIKNEINLSTYQEILVWTFENEANQFKLENILDRAFEKTKFIENELLEMANEDLVYLHKHCPRFRNSFHRALKSIDSYIKLYQILPDSNLPFVEFLFTQEKELSTDEKEKLANSALGYVMIWSSGISKQTQNTVELAMFIKDIQKKLFLLSQLNQERFVEVCKNINKEDFIDFLKNLDSREDKQLFSDETLADLRDNHYNFFLLYRDKFGLPRKIQALEIIYQKYPATMFDTFGIHEENMELMVLYQAYRNKIFQYILDSKKKEKLLPIFLEAYEKNAEKLSLLKRQWQYIYENHKELFNKYVLGSRKFAINYIDSGLELSSKDCFILLQNKFYDVIEKYNEKE